MNTFKFPAFLCLVLALSGCRDYEPENLRISAFMHAYGENFVAQVGQIAPEQSWDFSTAGGHRGQANRTRALHLEGEWYYPQEKTLTWMKNELKEGINNSGKCQDFYLSWTPGMTFDIVPIYEGLAYMKWDLCMKVISAEGDDVLYNKSIWSKGHDVQLYTTPSTTPGNFQYEENKAAIWFVTDKRQGGSDVYIWPWADGKNGEHFTGNQDTRGTRMKHVGSVGNFNIWQWNCTITTDIPTNVKFFLPNNEETGVYTFVNHGYLYESNLERPNDNFCIYFRTGRSNPKIYAWTEDDTKLAGVWPGSEMELVREEDPSHKIYKWTCDTRPFKVIFSSGSEQTSDIALDPSQQYAYYDDYADDSHKLSYLSKATNKLSVFTAPDLEDPDSGWHDFEDRSNAQYAERFRAKKINIPDLDNNNWPLGSIVTFYLKITNLGGADSNSATVGDEMSSLNKQIVYLNVTSEAMPTNVTTGEGVVTGILGCEDSKITGSSDKDYNDVVFLINGVMPEPVVITSEVSVSTVEKRYMAEDLTDTGDMDFNDIVVDVKNAHYTYWNVNESTNERTINTDVNGSRTVTVNNELLTLTFTNGICNVQTATVSHLCGTVPIRFKVGDTMLPWITDPTNLYQSQRQLRSEDVPNPTYGTGSETTSGINPDVTLPVTGWDPKTNNVFVYAGWDVSSGKATKPTTDGTDPIASGSDWCSGFPGRGTIPCIIATDVKDWWTAEFENITETPWWKANFISTVH